MFAAYTMLPNVEKKKKKTFIYSKFWSISKYIKMAAFFNFDIYIV